MNNQNEDSPKFPPARPDLTAEINAIDGLLTDLIVKCGGNARELDHLVGILDEHLATCETARDILLGIHQNQRQELTMTDLPMSQQKMIFGAGLFNSYLLEELGLITNTDPTSIGERVSLRVYTAMVDILPQQITDTLRTYLIKHEEAVKKYKEAVNEYQRNQIQNNNN